MENGIKTVYDLQSYWTSMAAILVSLGFTFLIDRMTEVLTPDIYIELTATSTQNTGKMADERQANIEGRSLISLTSE